MQASVGETGAARQRYGDITLTGAVERA